MRATAHYGLLLWTTSKVVDALIARVDDLGGEGKGLATDILNRLTGQTLPDRKRWESWWRQNRGAFRLPSIDERLKPIGGKKQ